jgi:UDP:flavonoid glycosyltransferase YjiC (YdhE family)
MRIVLCGVGSQGDIQPLLALGAALRARGHDVTLCAGANYADAAAGAGLAFRSMGRSIRDLVNRQGEALFNPVRFAAAAVPMLREMLDGLLAATEGADLVVGGAACFAGPTAASVHGARYCWAIFAPGTFPTAIVPHVASGLQPGRRWLNRLTHGVAAGILAPVLARLLNPVRARHDLPPVRGYADLVYRDDVLFAVDPAFYPVPPDWAVPAHQTGFWSFDDGAMLPVDVQRFLDGGDPPVYVGFGSMPARDPAERTRIVVDGILQSGRRGIVSAGWAGLGGIALPPEILSIGPVAHARLFPQCAMIVHHAGAGTTAAASRAGVPQLPVPHSYDQPAWARRLCELGVAGTTLSRRFDGSAMAQALSTTLDDRSLRSAAADLGQRLSKRDGASEAADWIEGRYQYP